MKKLMAFLICFSIILTTMISGIGSAVAYAEKYTPSPEGDFIAFDGIIEEYIGPGGDVVIPSEIDGVPIVEIAARSFFQCTDIETLVIPEGVEAIGHNAFEGCTNMWKLELPYTLCSIGATVFGDCTALEAVTIPSNVTKVPYGMFTGCTALSDIKFSNGVKEIHQFAFCRTSPKRLVFPESIDFISGASFNYIETAERVEIVICNPDLDLGRAPKEPSSWKDQLNGVFSDEIFRPWNSSKSPNMVFTINVPEGSKIAEFVKDWKNNGLLEVGKEDGACNNSYVVREKDEAFYADIEKEIAEYSIEKEREDLSYTSAPVDSGDDSNNTDNGDANANNNSDNTDNGDADKEDDNTDNGDANANNNNSDNTDNGDAEKEDDNSDNTDNGDADKDDDSDKADKDDTDKEDNNSDKEPTNDKTDGSSTTTTTIVEEPDDSNMMLILGIVGGVFLLIIIGVVIFAIFFLKKPKKAVAPQVVYMMGQDGKIIPVIPGQPAATEPEVATEEAPAEETPADDAE